MLHRFPRAINRNNSEVYLEGVVPWGSLLGFCFASVIQQVWGECQKVPREKKIGACKSSWQMNFKRVSQPIQDLPSAAKASEHHMLPPFPSLPILSHVDTKISKLQEDSDFILQKAISFQWMESREAEKGRRENSGGRGTLKKTSNFTLCWWWHGLMDLAEDRKEETIVLLFFEKEFMSSPKNLCLKANSWERVLYESSLTYAHLALVTLKSMNSEKPGLNNPCPGRFLSTSNHSPPTNTPTCLQRTAAQSSLPGRECKVGFCSCFFPLHFHYLSICLNSSSGYKVSKISWHR